MPPSSGPIPRLERSRLEPPSPSSPSPAAPAPASPGRTPFFLHAPAKGAIRTRASATRNIETPLMPTTFPICAPGRASLEPRRPRGRRIIRGAARQLFLALAVTVGDEEMVLARTRRREDEIATVGRPGGILVAAQRGDRLLARSLRRGDHDLKTAARACRVGDAIPLRGPRRRGVVAARVRDAGESRAVDAHDVDMRGARARGAERQTPAVGRPHG